MQPINDSPRELIQQKQKRDANTNWFGRKVEKKKEPQSRELLPDLEKLMKEELSGIISTPRTYSAPELNEEGEWIVKNNQTK